jgi:hypothetical protein
MGQVWIIFIFRLNWLNDVDLSLIRFHLLECSLSWMRLWPSGKLAPTFSSNYFHLD